MAKKRIFVSFDYDNDRHYNIFSKLGMLTQNLNSDLPMLHHVK